MICEVLCEITTTVQDFFAEENSADEQWQRSAFSRP